MSHTRFTERKTGLEVDVETVFCWDDENARAWIVTYPSVEDQAPRRFRISSEDLELHFAIVTPQEIFMTAYGGQYDRPSRVQKVAKLKALVSELLPE